MGKRFAIIVAALVAVFLGMIGVIWFATGDGPSAASPGGGSGAGADAPGATPMTGFDLAKAPLGGLPTPEYVIVKDEPAPPPPPGSWESVPIFQPRRGVINLDLEDVQPRITECFSPSVASRTGPVLETKDAAPLKDEMTTTLLLELEVTGDRVFIVDAPVESRGQASAGTLACAQAVLHARSVPSPGLPPGKHRLRYTLAP